MATVDELLDAEPESLYQDVNNIIIVDAEARQLIVPPAEVVLGVASDAKAERKFFRCPCAVSTDVSVRECEVHVNYENALGDRNHWLVNDLVYDGDFAVFSWEITEDVMLRAGNVQFSLCICKVRDGRIVREWNTTPATGIVLEGLEIE